MKVSYNWLQTYFDTPLPSPEEVAEKLTFHSFEVEGVETVGDDSVLDIDVLPNRAHDCLSHRGIAKECSVLFKLPLKKDVLRESYKEFPHSKKLTLSINDHINAPRHTAALITGVVVKDSPQWLQERLTTLGQRSINNIVDATNYVMLGLGQPTHAFDADKLTEKEGSVGIIIRSAKEEEKISLLGGEEYSLREGMMVLADSHSGAVLDIAGIKGGTQAELTKDTTSVVISAANFKGSSIRKTSQELKLRTDASTRFENGIAPEYARYGLAEVVTLILEIAGGTVEGIVDEFPLQKTIEYKSGVSCNEVNSLLGTTISESAIEDIFARLTFPFEKVVPASKVIEVAQTYVSTPYKYGASISYNAPHAFDCSSFVAYVFAQAGISLPRIAIDQYIYGTPIIESERKPGDVIFSTNGVGTKKEHSFTRLSDGEEVVHTGAQEKTQEFLSGTVVEGGVSHCGIYLGDDRVLHAATKEGVIEEKIEESAYFKNIVGYRRMMDAEDRYVVSIPFERLDLVAHTSFLTSGNKEDLIEEIGRIYGYGNIVAEQSPTSEKKVSVNKRFYYAEKVREFLTNRGFTEVYTYALQDSGEVEIENPIASDKKYLRPSLVTGLTQSLELNVKNIPLFSANTISLFELGTVFTNTSEHMSLGITTSKQEVLESIVADLKEEFGMPDGKVTNGVYECNFDAVVESLPEPHDYSATIDKSTYTYTPFSIYPFALRDIAVWVPESVSGNDVLTTITNTAGDLLVQHTLFDEFKKDGRVSYAFRLVFQSPEKTLSDEEIHEAMERVTTALNNTEGYEVR